MPRSGLLPLSRLSRTSEEEISVSPGYTKRGNFMFQYPRCASACSERSSTAMPKTTFITKSGRIGREELTAVTENISPGGAFLPVNLPESTTEIVASINLPHGRDLHVRAKVRWRRGQPPGVGVEFDTFLAGEADLKSLR